MNVKKGSASLRIVLAILLGTAFYAFSLNYFVLSNQLMEGGITGIALLLNYAAGVPLWLSNLVMNIPLFAMGWKIFGRVPMRLTVLGALSLSFFLWLMELSVANDWVRPFVTQDYLLAALYAGVTLGTGLGIVFRFGGTTGGADIIARIGNKWRGWSMGQFFLVFDAIVIGSSIFYIPKEKIMYTLVTVFISSKMIDFISEGLNAARAFTIITDAGPEMAKIINSEMDRGVTLLPAKGAYSEAPKDWLYCVVNRYEVRRLKTIARSVDPACFVIVSNVHDVVGEGFKES
jgi:uncharacterized membrane-anchored protein YitT (DUF2179 family)